MLLGTQFHGRRAAQLENDQVRVTVLGEGGHIAEVLHKASGVNPLWVPPWETIEPGSFGPEHHAIFGNNAEARLLAGIMGHNLCLDVFGGPSESEWRAGLGVHGEASVACYDFASEDDTLVQRAEFSFCRLDFERRLRLEGDTVFVEERITNHNAHDWPTAWTQHVSMGPPFIERGVTQFAASATRSKVFEGDFTGGLLAWQKPGAEFLWPHCPMADGSTLDLRLYPAAERSAGYTAHLMDPLAGEAYFAAFSPRVKVWFGYRWKRADFPWLGRWEENCLRTHTPWAGQTMTCGMEFGVSPMPETRRHMVERQEMFGVPGYRWLPAGDQVRASYEICIRFDDHL
ncbi:MAG: hypothetical protein J0L64_02180 [Acidobacteria bacterium]|nr:hypothetical protein [Acidobacteriota bacterium]